MSAWTPKPANSLASGGSRSVHGEPIYKAGTRLRAWPALQTSGAIYDQTAEVLFVYLVELWQVFWSDVEAGSRDKQCGGLWADEGLRLQHGTNIRWQASCGLKFEFSILEQTTCDHHNDLWSSANGWL